MDDLFLKSKNVDELQILLDGTSCVLKWAWMYLKTSESKPLVLTNGKVDHDEKLCIGTNQFRELIPTICSNPVKFLGRVISFDLTDQDQIEIIISAISTSLSLIDKSKHRGVHKIWILQYLLVPPMATIDI